MKIQKLLVYLEKVVGKLKLIEYIIVYTLMMIGYLYFDLIGNNDWNVSVGCDCFCEVELLTDISS